MNRTDKGVLQRVDIETKLPVEFERLSDEAKRRIIEKMADQDIELHRRLMEKVGQSKLAEYDLEVLIGTVEQLEAERKIYTASAKGETGSGKYELKIRGGDTKFIIPVLIVLGVIIVAIVALFILL